MVFVFQVQSGGQTQAKTEAPWLWQAMKGIGGAVGEGTWNYVIKPIGSIAYAYGPGTGTFEMGRQTYVAFDDGKYVEGGAMTAFTLVSAAADYTLVRGGYGLFKGTKGITATKRWFRIANEGLTKEEAKEFRKTGTISLEEPVEEASKKPKAEEKATKTEPVRKSKITKGLKVVRKEVSALKDDAGDMIKSAWGKTTEKGSKAATKVDAKMESWVTSNQEVFKRTRHLNEVKNVLQENKGIVGKGAIGTTYNALELGTGTVEGGIAATKGLIAISYMGGKYAVTRPFVNLPAGVVSTSTKIFGPTVAGGMQYVAGDFWKGKRDTSTTPPPPPPQGTTKTENSGVDSLKVLTPPRADSTAVAMGAKALEALASKFTDAEYAKTLGMQESEIASLEKAEKGLLSEMLSDTSGAGAKLLNTIQTWVNPETQEKDPVGALRTLTNKRKEYTLTGIAEMFEQ